MGLEPLTTCVRLCGWCGACSHQISCIASKAMVPHTPRHLQRGHLRVPRGVQTALSHLQCHALRGSAARGLTRTSKTAVHSMANLLRSIGAREGRRSIAKNETREIFGPVVSAWHSVSSREFWFLAGFEVAGNCPG